MKKTYNAIKRMPDEQLLKAFKELKEDKLPPRDESIVRVLQRVLTRENDGNTVALTSVQYQVALEVIERFANIK